MSDATKIPVLDHGFVRLVDSMGSDLSISRAARVSYDASWRAGEDEGSDARLIRYLWANKHTTPFEAVEFQFEVMAPIFVLRQWHRHRIGWTYNELSGRYRELPELFYVPAREAIGTQSKDNKQGRDLSREWSLADDVMRNEYVARCQSAFETYRRMLSIGWPRELARGVLPTAAFSHMFAKTNLHALFHFLSLRNDPHAQFEIRQYAQAIETLIEPIVPVAFAAWKEGRCGK